MPNDAPARRVCPKDSQTKAVLWTQRTAAYIYQDTWQMHYNSEDKTEKCGPNIMESGELINTVFHYPQKHLLHVEISEIDMSYPCS